MHISAAPKTSNALHSTAPSRGGANSAQIFHRRLSGSASILGGMKKGRLIAIRRGSCLVFDQTAKALPGQINLLLS
jgi:hypothetical protein